MMTNLLNYWLEANLALVVLYAFYALLLEKQTCFHFNRAYLLGATGFSLLLPLLNFPLPISWSGSPGATLLTTSKTVTEWVIPAASPHLGGNSIPWEWAVAIGYGLIVACLLLRLVYRLIQVKRLIDPYLDQAEKRSGYWLIRPREPLPIFSFLQYVCWNESESFSEADQASILRHEEAHVRGRHSWDILYLELLRAFCWPNLILILYQRALKQTHEYLADSDTLPFVDPYTYAQLIVKQASRPLPTSLVHPFSQPLIQNRLTMIHLHKHPTRVYRLWLALPVTLLLSLALACKPDLPTPLPSAPLKWVEREKIDGGMRTFNQSISQNLRITPLLKDLPYDTRWTIKSQLIFDRTGKLISTKIIACESKEFAPYSLESQDMWKMATQALQQASQQPGLHLTTKAAVNRVFEDEYVFATYGTVAQK
ncbi:MAG: hypothetical protein V4714_00745 [Bacteroidota bacterium]